MHAKNTPGTRALSRGRAFFWSLKIRRPTYASLLASGTWRALPSCPGRLVWRGDRFVTPADLLGPGVEVAVFDVEAASDPVHVGRVEGGGLISYRRADGEFAHTLNTDEGLTRKLDQLGIPLDDGG